MPMNTLNATGPRIPGVAMAVTLTLALTSLGRSQPLSPFSEFQSMSIADLATLQVKLTYMGSQNAGIASIVFTAPGNIVNVALFTPFHRPDQAYFNDEFSPQTFAASPQDLKALIDSVGALSDVADGHVDPGGTVSFTLLNTAGGTTRAFESIVNRTNGRLLFGRMLAALQNNPEAVRSLRSFGCAVGMLPATPPTDVTAQATIVGSGLRADRKHPTQFVGKVRVTNTSGTTISAPMVLVILLDTDATLLGADGTTCAVTPIGHPFINLLTSGTLASGTTIERVLRFANPSGSKLNATFRLYAGAGAP